MTAFQAFLCFQFLDFITTIVGFRVGAGEASPFIARLIHASSPVQGVAVSKIVALALAGVCTLTNRTRLVVWINYWYGALVVWNIAVIAIALNRHANP